MKAIERVHFKGLDSLRFFAAFSLILYHSTLNFQSSFSPRLKNSIHNLTIGVDLFFIISGFLIVYLLVAERHLTGTIQLRKFYLRRLLRIFPLYFLIVGLAYISYRNYAIHYPSFLCFTANFWLIEKGDWTVGMLNPLWSLCIEEQFYLVIPLLVAVLPRRCLPYLFVSIILGSITFRWYAATYIEWPWMTLYCHTLSRCDLLAIGGLIAVQHHRQPFAFRLPKLVPWLAVLVLGSSMLFLDYSDFSSLPKAVFKKYLFLLPLLILFYQAVFTGGRTRESKVFKYLGSISYGLYMYHTPVIEMVSGNDFINQSPLLKPITVILLTIPIAGLSFRYFEQPLLHLKKRFAIIRT